MYHFTALVTVVAILLYFYTGFVGKARAKFGIKAPAMIGK